MQGLSKRLQMVLRSVPCGSSVADIGTDHAFLPIALVQKGIASKVIACDIAEGPLAVAKRNVEKSQTNNIELRLSNGLQKVKAEEVDVITITGMGGDLISRIIEAAPWVKSSKKRLVLGAMTSADSLRDYLYKEGFNILSESAVSDGGRIYSVITASYDGVVRKCSEAERLIGKLSLDTSPDATRYIEIQLRRISKCAESLKNVERKQREYEKVLLAQKELSEILLNRST